MQGLTFLVLATIVAFSSAFPRPSTYVFPGRNSGKIVGGVEANRHEFKYIVDMRNGGGHYCGGSIISPEWVVTAAHCSQGSGYTLTAGDHNIDVNDGTEQVRDVVKIIIHPRYQSPSAKQYENDIALMQVFPPFEFNEFVGPVTLPKSGFEPTDLATVTGWGALYQSGPSPSNLMKVEVPYVNDTQCNMAYSNRIAASMICYGEGGKDSCQGDSGGPILCNGNTLCGIVSWGQGCAQPNYPGVYTETSYFEEWIIRSTVPAMEDDVPDVTTESCGGFLQVSSALINFSVDKDLTPNSRCTWTLKAPHENLRFRLLSSGLGPNDGVFATRFSNSDTTKIDEVGHNYTTGGGVILITLSVGDVSPGKGFSLEVYSSGYGDSSELTGYADLKVPAGSFSYPVSGGQYQERENALFVLNPSGVENKNLTFTAIDVEDDSSCSYDAVTVFTWTNNQFSQLLQFCGRIPPVSLIIPQGLALVTFKSDSTINGNGFTFEWSNAQ